MMVNRLGAFVIKPKTNNYRLGGIAEQHAAPLDHFSPSIVTNNYRLFQIKSIHLAFVR
jgi:hypothetical protein